MTVGLLAMPFVAEVPVVALVLVVSTGNGLVTVTLASLLATAGPPEETGARMGQGQSAASAARATGPLAAGALFDLAVIVPYLLGAALSASVAFLSAIRSTTDDRARDPVAQHECQAATLTVEQTDICIIVN